ncbi:MAG: hypothetical protein PF795_01305 [Kiritimatiellae bacterium]|jgi:hypothetical protein|nr:hypothetical protein [Kiritimatiellia bacterium]
MHVLTLIGNTPPARNYAEERTGKHPSDFSPGVRGKSLRVSIRPVTALVGMMLTMAGPLKAEPMEPNHEAKAYDFADAVQLDDFLESPKVSEQRYPHSDTPGVGGIPGRLLSLNRGAQGQALHATTLTYDITEAPVSVRVKFQYGEDKDEQEKATRILLVLSQPGENLIIGSGKLGMRVFKAENPTDPSRPWQFQLINSTSTRNIGEPFAMEAGNWYELEGSFHATPDGKSVKFSISFRDFGVEGVTSGLLGRSTEGGTTANTHYDVRRVMIGLLGQHAGSGAVAFDDLEISSSAAQVPPPTLAPVEFLPRPPTPGLSAPAETIFGVCGHVIHTSRFYEGKNDYWGLEYTLPYLLDADLGWVREAIYQPWFANRERKDVDSHRADLERYLTMYEEHGVKVMLAIMATPPNDQWVKYNDDFFDYIAELVARFDCVKVVEMHNEPNLKFFWSGTPQEYVKIYSEAARVIRAARPDITLAVGSISSLWWGPGVEWLDDIIDAGALEWADAISVHPYNTKQPPETDPHFTGAPADTAEHRDLALDAWWSHVSAAAPEGKDLKVYFTEFGYSSVDEGIAGIGSEKLQADYLSRVMMSFLAARLRGFPLEGVFWYDFKDDGARDNLGEHNFGLIRHDLSRVKPGYAVYAAIAEHFQDADDLEPLELEISSLNLPEVLKTYSWKRKSDGALIIPFWRMEQLQQVDADFSTRLDVSLPDDFSIQKIVLHTLQNDHAQRTIGFTGDEGSVSIPLYVDSRVAWIVIKPKRVQP